MKFKFQNTKLNRKDWIIIGTDGLLYGVNRRNFPVFNVEEFLGVDK